MQDGLPQHCLYLQLLLRPQSSSPDSNPAPLSTGTVWLHQEREAAVGHVSIPWGDWLRRPGTCWGHPDDVAALFTLAPEHPAAQGLYWGVGMEVPRELQWVPALCPSTAPRWGPKSSSRSRGCAEPC